MSSYVLGHEEAAIAFSDRGRGWLRLDLPSPKQVYVAAHGYWEGNTVCIGSSQDRRTVVTRRRLVTTRSCLQDGRITAPPK